jgi:hypothetical protein
MRYFYFAWHIRADFGATSDGDVWTVRPNMPSRREIDEIARSMSVIGRSVTVRITFIYEFRDDADLLAWTGATSKAK